MWMDAIRDLVFKIERCSGYDRFAHEYVRAWLGNDSDRFQPTPSLPTDSFCPGREDGGGERGRLDAESIARW